MINIGIIGSQSMHGEAFAAACNIPDENGKFFIEDCRINAICGIDDVPEHTEKTAQKANIPTIVKDPLEMLSMCDAVMILFRRGDERIKYAKPFLDAGMPVFLDKPVCISREDMDILRGYAAKGNQIIAGGSGLKNCSEILEIKKLIDKGELGEVKGISLNHHSDIEDVYGGIYFYACHAMEIAFTLLGFDPRSVHVSVLNRNNYSTYIKYEDKFAEIIYTPSNNGHFITVYGDEKNVSINVNTSDIFTNTIKDFAKRIREKKYTTSVEELITHVDVLRAVAQSIETQKEVIL